ncbi:hypothetical protein niasHT_022830 [Heterodera trifolii]|uniref:aspartyl aminopeptidase n=1 Tax=Heterodera trifolii TaxID=157864 RepID=A0ABD2JKI7_9BILA
MQPNEGARNIIAAEREQLSEEARMSLPSTSGLRRTIERQRELPERRNVDAVNLQAIEIAGQFALDHSGQQFLIFDSREDEPDGSVFFIFCSQEGRRRLRTYRHWVEQVIPAFNLLRARMNLLQFQNNADSIFDYFGRTYVIRPNGADPLFVPTSWNHHDSIIGNLARTNNAQEAFHLALRRQFAKEHPPLSRLINVLKSEERIATDRLREYEVDNTRGINLRPRAKKYRENDAAIKRMLIFWQKYGPQKYGPQLSSAIVVRKSTVRNCRPQLSAAKVRSAIVVRNCRPQKYGPQLSSAIVVRKSTVRNCRPQLSSAIVRSAIAGCKTDQILDMDMFLYDTQPATLSGLNEEFISGARLDNLVSTYTAIKGLVESLEDTDAFDADPNVGSRSAQGAQSHCFEWLLRRVLSTVDHPTAFECSIGRSFMVSADQAHSVHPNYAHKHEERHKPSFHRGVVVKVNANQNYATTAVTHSVLKVIADSVGVPLQKVVVRNDSRCGSTVGPILAAKLGIQVGSRSAQGAQSHCFEWLLRRVLSTVDHPTAFDTRLPVVIATDGTPLPTDAAGITVDLNGNPLPTNFDGKPIGADGMPLSTDATGRFVWTTTVTAAPFVIKALPTDESGKILFPSVDEFGADEAPRVVIVWKSGSSSSAPDKLRHTADLLRQQYGALVLVVTAGGLVTTEDRAMAAGHSDPLVFDRWAEVDADALGMFVDTICKSRADFDIVLSHLTAFLLRHFSVESQRLRLNLIGVDEKGLIAPVEELIPVEQFSNKTKKLKEWRTLGEGKGKKWKSSAAPNLSKGLQASAKLSQSAIEGQESVLILISREGTSSISELDETQQQQQVVAISVDYPLSNLLKKMAGNSSNRVIHFPAWTGDNVPKQFSRWLTLAICSAINASTMARRKVTPSPSAQNDPKLIQNTTQMPKWLQLQRQNAFSSAVADLVVPRHVLIRPFGSDSLLISWSPCCESHRPPFNLSLLYSSDPSLRFSSLWSHRFVSCADNSVVRLQASAKLSQSAIEGQESVLILISREGTSSIPELDRTQQQQQAVAISVDYPLSTKTSPKRAVKCDRIFRFIVYLSLIGSVSAGIDWPLVKESGCTWPYGSGGLPGWAIAAIVVVCALLIVLPCMFCLPCSPIRCRIFGRKANGGDNVERGDEIADNLQALAKDIANYIKTAQRMQIPVNELREAAEKKDNEFRAVSVRYYNDYRGHHDTQRRAELYVQLAREHKALWNFVRLAQSAEDKAQKHVARQNRRKLAKSQSVVSGELSTSGGAVVPSTSGGVVVPSTSGGADVPSTSGGADVPSTSGGAVVPSTSSGAVVPREGGDAGNANRNSYYQPGTTAARCTRCYSMWHVAGGEPQQKQRQSSPPAASQHQQSADPFADVDELESITRMMQ